MSKSFSFQRNEQTEWLSVLDAFLSVRLLGNDKRVLEIGVWKGGWAKTLFENLYGIDFVGIDPYPGLSHIKDAVLNENKGKKYFELYDSVEDFETNASIQDKFNCIHIDGEHTEKAVLRDFQFSASLLLDDGIIIVDDFFDLRFPGVTYATFALMKALNFSIFLISERKAYLCKSQFHQMYYSRAKNILLDANLVFSEGFPLGSFGENYPQPNQIAGYGNILVREFTNKEFMNRFLIPKNKFFLVKNSIKLFIPPILMQSVHKILIFLSKYSNK